MFEAQYLFGGDEVYSPWLPREGDNLQVQVNAISNDLTTNFTVSMYTKNREDSGVPGTGNPLTPVDSNVSFASSTTGVKSAQYLSAVKELVRYKFTATGSSDEKVLFRVLPIVWWDDVEA